MYKECQELLQMFGIPYLIAPQEAEAQCAWLDEAGLVDGVVTDDSDVFLFGGQRVYRHIFENQKYAESYYLEDVQRELGLTREKLISLVRPFGFAQQQKHAMYVAVTALLSTGE
jgi:DNA excision repair protein ERCC-5